MAEVEAKKTGATLLVSVNNPPVNALSHVVRSGLFRAIVSGDDDPEVRAILILCQGKTFFAGADIAEFGKPAQEPSLSALVDRIDGCSKPVIAAIHGSALGGGLEVALACHYRIAAQSSTLGLPEVKLGLMPGAGGTQLLPRLAGLENALDMIANGDPISSERAVDSGIVDRVVDDCELSTEGIQYAEEVSGIRPLPRASKRDVNGELCAIDAFTEKYRRRLKHLDASSRIFEALRASIEKPYRDGRLTERAGFEALLVGAQSKALRHVFFAERKARIIDDLSDVGAPAEIKRAGVVGAGTMGIGISVALLSAGISVELIERESSALDRGVNKIRETLVRAEEKGKLPGGGAAEAIERLSPGMEISALENVDLAIEAAFELMEIKKAIFTELELTVPANAILASNTSYLDVNEIAASTNDPARVLGLHFFSPANIMKLLEIVRGTHTSASTLVTAMAFAKRLGKVGVISGVCDGFIGNRMLKKRQEQATRLILEGASVIDVDATLRDFGFPMGPFQMTDLAGLDIGWDPKSTSGSTLKECLCEAGLRGQKSGEGYYKYGVNKAPELSQTAELIIRTFAEDQRIAQRKIDRDEIRDRLLLPLVNEGVKIISEGIAQRASDIDVVWVNGYGWPRHTGGPMYWADMCGLENVLDSLMRWEDQLGNEFSISSLLREKAKRGDKLCS